MKKLNLDALKDRAEEVATVELMNSINGGLENGCHTGCQVSFPGPSTPAPRQQ
jgi:hypothetical protein